MSTCPGTMSVLHGQDLEPSIFYMKNICRLQPSQTLMCYCNGVFRDPSFASCGGFLFRDGGHLDQSLKIFPGLREDCPRGSGRKAHQAP